MADFKDGLIGSFEAAKRIGISIERLRYWEHAGIVNPEYTCCGIRKYRRYSGEDISRAVLIKKLVDEEKYTLGGAITKLKNMN